MSRFQCSCGEWYYDPGALAYCHMRTPIAHLCNDHLRARMICKPAQPDLLEAAKAVVAWDDEAAEYGMEALDALPGLIDELRAAIAMAAVLAATPSKPKEE